MVPNKFYRPAIAERGKAYKKDKAKAQKQAQFPHRNKKTDNGGKNDKN